MRERPIATEVRRAYSRCPSRSSRRCGAGPRRTEGRAPEQQDGRRSRDRIGAPQRREHPCRRTSISTESWTRVSSPSDSARPPGSGASAKPVTSAPARASASVSHDPTKPLWPVTSTRRPRNRSSSRARTLRTPALAVGAVTRSSKERSRTTTVPRARALSRRVSIGCQNPPW